MALRFYKIQLRTKKEKSVIVERSTTLPELRDKIVEDLRKQMFQWERTHFSTRPLEVVVEEDRLFR